MGVVRLSKISGVIVLGVVVLATVMCCVAVASHSVSCEKSKLATSCVLAHVGNRMVGAVVMMGVVVLLAIGAVFVVKVMIVDSGSKVGRVRSRLRRTIELCLSDYLLAGFRLGRIRAQVYG